MAQDAASVPDVLNCSSDLLFAFLRYKISWIEDTISASLLGELAQSASEFPPICEFPCPYITNLAWREPLIFLRNQVSTF